MFLSMFLLAASSVVHGSTEPCSAAMPVSLRSALEVRFPSFRVPVVNDNLPFDIEYDKENGGDGCLGVAEGDYNGDGQQDRALLLTAVTSQEDSRQVVLTVVGFGGQNGWQLEVLRDWGRTSRDGLYVSTVPPGEYKQTEALSEPPDAPGGVVEIRSRNEAVATGVTESSRVVYVWIDGRWFHVWVAD